MCHFYTLVVTKRKETICNLYIILHNKNTRVVYMLYFYFSSKKKKLRLIYVKEKMCMW